MDALRRLFLVAWSGLAVAIAIGAVVLTILAPNFLTEFNIYVMLRSFCVALLVGFAQMATLGVGQMNIAVGALGGLVAISLGGMLEVPSSSWQEGEIDKAVAKAEAPFDLAWFALPGVVRHGFTHFELEFTVLAGHAPKNAKAPKDCVWWPRAKIAEAGLPTVFAKIAKHAP